MKSITLVTVLAGTLWGLQASAATSPATQAKKTPAAATQPAAKATQPAAKAARPAAKAAQPAAKASSAKASSTAPAKAEAPPKPLTFDEQMRSVLADYLEIQTALAANNTKGVADASGAILKMAKVLHTSTLHGRHARLFKALPKRLTTQAGRIHAAKSLAEVRVPFKKLSQAMSMWVSMAHVPGYAVLYCHKARAPWVEQGDGKHMHNPYFGAAETPPCGRVIFARR